MRRGHKAFDGKKFLIDRIDADPHGFKGDCPKEVRAILLTEDLTFSDK